MALFGSMIRDFDEDPFFSSHQDHMRRMQQMMGNFMDPFESLFGNMSDIMGLPRLMPPSIGRNQNPRREEQGLTPIGFGSQFGFPMRGMMTNFQNLANDPNCHSYSSSSVFTYSTGDDGAPKVYQAAASTRSAPGGVKETRKTVCDSESGMKKMSIGHHLGDKAHIVEKTKYSRTGQEEEAEEFINIGEEDAAQFNQQWRQKVDRPSAAALPALTNRPRRRHEDNVTKAALPTTSRKRDNEDDQGGDKSRRKSKAPKGKQHKRECHE